MHRKKRSSNVVKDTSDTSSDDNNSDVEIIESKSTKQKVKKKPVKKKQRRRRDEEETESEDDDDGDSDGDDYGPKSKRGGKSPDADASRALVTFEQKANAASLGVAKMFTINELRHEVWLTLVDKVKEWFGIFTYEDFELLLKDANADIRHHLNWAHNPPAASSASSAAAASSNSHNAVQWSGAGDDEEGSSKDGGDSDDENDVEILDSPPVATTNVAKRWSETHVVAACSYVSDKVIERVKQIHQYLEQICKELNVVAPEITKDDAATLLHLHHIAFIRDVDRAKPIDFKVLLSAIKAEQNAMDDILKLKLRFAKQVKVSAGHPMYGNIQKPAEWDASENWTDGALTDGARLYDVVTEKRIIDDKQAVIMYHGSAIHHMNSFQKRGVAFIGGGALGSGFYMAANPNEAQGYAFSRSGHSVAGLLLEIAVFNADQLIGDVSGQYGDYRNTKKYHFTRNRVAPNQFVFRDTKLFKENFKVLTCYTLDPGFNVEYGSPFAAPAASAAAAAGGSAQQNVYRLLGLPPVSQQVPAKKASTKRSTTTKSKGKKS
jgi:hypothetical protein